MLTDIKIFGSWVSKPCSRRERVYSRGYHRSPCSAVVV